MRGVAGEAPGARARPRSRSLPRAHARALMVAVARGHAARAASAAPNAALRRGERTPLRVARAGRRAHGCAPRTADPRRFPAGSRGACECDRPCAAGMNRARCGGRCRRSASRVSRPATAHPRERSRVPAPALAPSRSAFASSPALPAHEPVTRSPAFCGGAVWRSRRALARAGANPSVLGHAHGRGRGRARYRTRTCARSRARAHACATQSPACAPPPRGTRRRRLPLMREPWR